MKKIKRFTLALIVAAILSLPAIASAEPQGCNQWGCWYSGWWIEWTIFGPTTCGWWQMMYYDGSYFYQDCHSYYAGWY